MLGMGVYQISSGLNLFAEDFGVTSVAPWFWMYVGLFAFFLISLRVWIMMEEHKARQGMEIIVDEGSFDMNYDKSELTPPLT
jgi:hypothetical protein